MKEQAGLNLNLATHPIKNRRLYSLLLAVLVSVMAFLLVACGLFYSQHLREARGHREAAKRIDAKIDALQKERGVLSTRIGYSEKLDKKKIDLINRIIFSKSFSWTDFLSALENALPDASAIVSLAPSLKEDFNIEVRIKVTSPFLEDLLKFITRLDEQGFTQIRVISEGQTDNGYLISEVALNYEETF